MKSSNATLITAAVFVLLSMSISGCKKEKNNTVEACGVTSVTDADGNSYGVVKIGNQCWMTSNLKTTKYRDGTPIPKVTDGWDWWHDSTGAYCDYDNNPANSAVYGRLYNWYTISTHDICPVGWHVPSESEWNVMKDSLGDVSLAGGKLKEADTLHWQSPNASATNETGFTALPGGYRSSTGSFFSLRYNGYFWEPNQNGNTGNGRYQYLDYSLGGIYVNEDYKVDGLSIRCVKD